MNKHITHQGWMKIVSAISEYSTCRVQIGCIILQNKRIVATGYVGSLPGEKHCEDVGCLYVDAPNQGSGSKKESCIRTIHAETNASLQCMVRGTKENPLIAYCTYSPCLACLKIMLSIGINKIYYIKDYKDTWRDIYLKNLENEIRQKRIRKHIVNLIEKLET